jgi:hypothetical protein
VLLSLKTKVPLPFIFAKDFIYVVNAFKDKIVPYVVPYLPIYTYETNQSTADEIFWEYLF